MKDKWRRPQMPNELDIRPGRPQRRVSYVQERIAAFLTQFTRDLLSQSEQREALDVFVGLTRECLADEAALERWKSELSFAGTPIEFSVAVDEDAAVSVRFAVDTVLDSAESSESVKTLRSRADLVIPCAQDRAELLDQILDRHLSATPRDAGSCLAHGIRLSPGKTRAGRLYFQTWRQPREDVHVLLSSLLHPDDMKLLRTSSLGSLGVLGVAYDFNDQGLARIKIYSWTEGQARETAVAAAREFLGSRADSLYDTLELVSRHKHPLWSIPRICVGVGFRPEGDYRDLKLSLPVLPQWGWNRFHHIQPVVWKILRQWGIPVPEVAADPEARPQWRFFPSWLSVDASPKGESLSVYFLPTKKLIESDPLPSRPFDTTSPQPAEAPVPRDKAFQAYVLGKMFSLLLGSEAIPGEPA